MKKSEFEDELGIWLGWGPSDDWNDFQADRIKAVGKAAARRFYYPSPPYNWSFLRVPLELTLADGESTIALPDDWGGMDGEIAVSDSSNGVFPPLRVFNPGEIDQRYSMSPDCTGRPQMAAEQPGTGPSLLKGPRKELYVFPTADADYTLKVRYYLNADYITDQCPYLYAGAEHSEAIKLAYKAAAEEEINNLFGGPMAAAYQRQLMTSMAMDRRMKAQVISGNRDRSDDSWYGANLMGYLDNFSAVDYTPTSSPTP